MCAIAVGIAVSRLSVLSNGGRGNLISQKVKKCWKVYMTSTGKLVNLGRLVVVMLYLMY